MTALPTLEATSCFSVSNMRERRYLTFDMNNPRHAEALSILSAQPDRLKSEYVISCILEAQQSEWLEGMIRQTIGNVLKELKFTTEDASPAKQATDDISDLPDALLSMMDDI